MSTTTGALAAPATAFTWHLRPCAQILAVALAFARRLDAVGHLGTDGAEATANICTAAGFVQGHLPCC